MNGDPVVVCVGAVTVDTIALVDALPPRDGRVTAHDVRRGGGGPAATAAVTLARLGVPVAFVGQVGDDDAGAQARAELEREGVDVRALRTLHGTTTASVIMVEIEHNTRTIATTAARASIHELSPAAVRLCRDAGWVHVDQAGYGAAIAAGIPGSGPLLSVDAGNPMPGLELNRVALYAPNESALAARYPGRDLDARMRAALDEGAELVAVTRGARGSAAARGSEIVSVPATVRAEVVSTLGAGDVFHGALLSALVAGMPLERALQWANAAAALSCRALDGRSAIPTAHELEAALAGASQTAIDDKEN